MQREPTSRTTQPIVTGASVLGVRYRDGVLVATDSLASYGSMARYTDLRRMHQAGARTIVTADGDYADFQSLQELLEELELNDFLEDDRAELSPAEYHSFLSRYMYQRRNKMDPLWNDVVVAGFQDGEAFLGYVDKRGTSFRDNIVTTGFGTHVALPLMRRAWRPDMTEQEAAKLLHDCMGVLFYRHCNAFNRYFLGRADATGCHISGPLEITTKWDYELYAHPKQWKA